MKRKAQQAVKDQVKRLARRAGYDIVPFARSDGALENHLAMLFDLLEINCVIDVGAHRGGFGRLLGEIGFGGYIISFEPVKENFDALSRASALNSRWTVHHLALGSTDGTTKINVSRRTEFSSLWPTSQYGLEQYPMMSEPVGVERVRMARLDEIFDSIVGHIADPRIFLKIDTQGNDIDVVRGARDSLDKVEALQTELYFREVYSGTPLFNAAYDELRGAGFELTGLYAASRGERLVIIDADCVMVRTQHGADPV
jgi:FkbM family methyltransferase